MGMEQNSLTSSVILCRYGDTDDVFPIGGLVDIGETPIAAGSRYCRQQINFVFKSPDQLCLFKVIDSVIDLNPIRINMFILDVRGNSLTTLYRTRHCASQLANAVNTLSNNLLDDVDDYVFPPPIISTTIWGKYDEALIYDWYGAIDKTLCFDFGILIAVKEIENNLDTDLRTTPPMLGEFVMRNSVGSKEIWFEITKALRLRIFDFDLKYNWEVGSTLAVVHPTSTVVNRPSLPPCLGESDEILNNHWEQSKIKLIDAGINVNSREAVCILVDSFAGKLGTWASEKATLINELNTISALGAFMEVNYIINEDLAASEYVHLQYLIELNQNGESLTKYTRAFNCSYGYLKNDISLKAAAIWYIKGLKSPSLSAQLWSNWINGKYIDLLTLQTDAIDISLKL
jgi:hypothetical protein